MRQRRLQVWNSRKKDSCLLVMVVRLEHELIPKVRVRAVFQKPMQRCPLVRVLETENRPFKKLRPVSLRGFDQDVGRRKDDVVIRHFWQQWRQQANIPEFSLLSSIAGGAVTNELLVGDQLFEPNVFAVYPDMLVDPLRESAIFWMASNWSGFMQTTSFASIKQVASVSMSSNCRSKNAQQVK